jgi:hypothetical protein
MLNYKEHRAAWKREKLLLKVELKKISLMSGLLNKRLFQETHNHKLALDICQ